MITCRPVEGRPTCLSFLCPSRCCLSINKVSGWLSIVCCLLGWLIALRGSVWMCGVGGLISCADTCRER